MSDSVAAGFQKDSLRLPPAHRCWPFKAVSSRHEVAQPAASLLIFSGCTTREEAMAAFREAFDRMPDNTVDKSA